MALTDNLAAYWALEADGTDSTGGGSTLTNSGAAFVAAKVGNGADFESGDPDYMYRADSATLSMGDIDFTIAAWVNGETWAGANRSVVSKDWDGLTNLREYRLLYNDSSSRFRFALGNGTTSTYGSVDATSFGAPSTGTWYFLVAYHDAAANTVSICVNDGTVDSAATTGAGQDTTSQFELGRYGGGSPSYFDGIIDEVGIWKRKLTAAEITFLYNGGTGRTYAEVVAGMGQPMQSRVAMFPYHAARLTPGGRPGYGG